MTPKEAARETLEIAHRYLAHKDYEVRLMAQITIKYCIQILEIKDETNPTP